MSKIYLEILDRERQEVFKKLYSFKRVGYLAGGTALALQLRHRKSLDFDVFIKKPVNNRLRLKIEKIFRNVKTSLDTGDIIISEVDNGIGVTFVWYYFKLLYPVVKTNSLSLASVFDIAADKAYTIGRRATWRDYIDIFILLEENIVNIEKIVSLAKRKFSGSFNESLFLEQLVYFKDLKVAPIEFIKEKPSESEVKSFLEKKVDEHIKDRLPKR